jgi:hypothetical protein
VDHQPPDRGGSYRHDAAHSSAAVRSGSGSSPICPTARSPLKPGRGTERQP